MSLATRTVGVGNIKDLIHTGMEGIGFKDLRDLVDQVKDHGMYFGMQGAVTLTVEAIGIGPFVLLRKRHFRGFIELGIDLQEFAGFGGP